MFDEDDSPYKPCPICGARAFDNCGDGTHIECGNEKKACPLAGYTLPVELLEALPRPLPDNRYDAKRVQGVNVGRYKTAPKQRKFEQLKHLCPVCVKAFKDVAQHTRWHEGRGEVEVVKMPYATYETFFLHDGVHYRR